MIHVRPRQYRKVMVNGQEYPQISWEPKGRKGKAQKASIRSVPFPSDLIPTLEQLKNESDGSHYLFLSLSRLERLSGLLYPDGTVHDIKLINNLNRQFDKIQKAAFTLLKLEDWKPMCIHDLRETYITNAAHYVPISTLCRYAGHADPKTTIRYYTSVNTRDADAMREAMADDKPDLKLVG